MNVLIVSPEAVPFAKTGGLADVAGSLPKYLTRLGASAALVMPLYQKVPQSGQKLVKMAPTIRVPIGDKVLSGSIWQSTLPDSDTPAYFLDQRDFYNRPELYGANGKDYPDNCQRFIFFCRGTLELIKALGLKVDVLHLNDWQTGLIPAYIRTLYARESAVADIATLFTIHNLAYQGLFWHWDMPLTGLSWDLFNWTELEFYGKLSFMKSGLVFADALSTVSKQYAREIQTEENGAGLEGVLTQRRDDLFGVVNGVDYTVWNPEVDRLLPANYSASDLRGKAACKTQLQKEQHLAVRGDVPLIGIISRLVDSKGFDLLSELFDEMMKLDLQFVLLGTGEPKLHELFAKIARDHPQKASVYLTFDNTLAHEIEAGADMFLMPSRYEPCGLNQFYSLRYGTIPIVRKTGGLADSIVNYSAATSRKGVATGFVFEKCSAKAMLGAIKKAVDLYRRDSKAWTRLRLTAMKQDFTWTASAREYDKLLQAMAAEQPA